jgi:hypothetical protein
LARFAYAPTWAPAHYRYTAFTVGLDTLTLRLEDRSTGRVIEYSALDLRQPAAACRQGASTAARLMGTTVYTTPSSAWRCVHPAGGSVFKLSAGGTGQARSTLMHVVASAKPL